MDENRTMRHCKGNFNNASYDHGWLILNQRDPENEENVMLADRHGYRWNTLFLMDKWAFQLLYGLEKCMEKSHVFILSTIWFWQGVIWNFHIHYLLMLWRKRHICHMAIYFVIFLFQEPHQCLQCGLKDLFDKLIIQVSNYVKLPMRMLAYFLLRKSLQWPLKKVLKSERS